MDKRPLEITVCCFFWGDWCEPHGPDYVNRLFRGVKKHLTVPHRFVCFTDRLIGHKLESGIETIKFDLPRWDWNLRKSFLFNPNNGLKGRVVCLDLDVVIVADFGDLAGYDGWFATCEAAYRKKKCGGSIIGFEAGDKQLQELLWNPLLRDRKIIEQQTMGSERKYFNQRLPMSQIDFWQQLYPGKVLSYKLDCKEGLPDGASIVRFHGRPRPHEVNDDWVKEHWYG